MYYSVPKQELEGSMFTFWPKIFWHFPLQTNDLKQKRISSSNTRDQGNKGSFCKGPKTKGNNTSQGFKKQNVVLEKWKK